MKLFLRASCLFVCLLLVGVYSRFAEQKPVKASRAIASIEKTFNFLTYEELRLLNPKDLKSYFNDMSEAFSKASFLKGPFGSREDKVSYFNFIEKAFADVYCEKFQGLHTPKAKTQEDCGFPSDGMKINDAKSEFMEAETLADAKPESRAPKREGLKGSTLFCPKGEKMCSPIMVGFKFSNGKASLKCLPASDFSGGESNSKCYETYGKNVSTAELKKSLELLEKANPKFWDEFVAGVKAVCLEENGRFAKDDPGCEYMQEKINQATLEHRGALSREYKDLADELKKARELDENGGKACAPATYNDTLGIRGLQDPENFREEGQKVVVQGGKCWRLPYNSTATIRDGKIEFRLPRANIPFLKLPRSVGASDLGRAKFYNFNCGPCNKAKKLSLCVGQQQDEVADRTYENLSLYDTGAITSMDDCRSLIMGLRTQEVPEALNERIRAQGKQFFEMEAIN